MVIDSTSTRKPTGWFGDSGTEYLHILYWYEIRMYIHLTEYAFGRAGYRFCGFHRFRFANRFVIHFGIEKYFHEHSINKFSWNEFVRPQNAASQSQEISITVHCKKLNCVYNVQSDTHRHRYQSTRTTQNCSHLVTKLVPTATNIQSKNTKATNTMNKNKRNDDCCALHAYKLVSVVFSNRFR